MTRLAWLACRAEARAQVRDACKIGEGATMTTRRECGRLVRSEIGEALAYSLLPAWDWLACPLDIRFKVRGDNVRAFTRVREMSKGGAR